MAGMQFTNQRPPQNSEAEEAVLGGILLDNEALFQAMELLTPEDFYRDTYGKIFQCCLELADRNEPIDLVTLSQHLKEKGWLEAAGGSSKVASLLDIVPSATNVPHYARIVREKSIMRQLIAVATDIIRKGYDETTEVEDFLDFAESSVFRVTDAKIKPDFVTLKDIVKENFKRIETLYEKKDFVTGVPTGFYELDKLTSGFQPSDLVIIAGRPSMGKTSFALGIAQNAAIHHQIPVALFSLEMSKEQLVMRMLTSQSKVDASRLRIGKLKDTDWPKLTKGASQLSEAPIYIDDTPALAVMDMRSKCRRLKSECQIGMIVVDYLQLVRSRGKLESREREISEISRSLKALAKELSVPVVALSQLNRSVESRNDKRPQLADLRESGAIEQDADLIAFIYRDEVYNKDTEWAGVAEVIVGKQRNGPIGMVRLAFLNEYTSFENLSYE